MLKFKTLLIAAALLALPGTASATLEADEVTIQQLMAQIEALSNRVSELENDSREYRKESSAKLDQVNTQSDSSWAESIKLNGDFRYRMEHIDQQGSAERNRQRVRARASIVAQPRVGLELGLGVATGGDDPVSTNQTLGGGGTSKGLNLDLAYFKYSGLSGTSIVAGKYKNFLVQPSKNQLLWDGDWSPEGIGVAWSSETWFANAMGSWIESDSNKTDTEFAYVLQAGINRKFSSGSGLTAGVSYTDFGTAGKGSFYGADDEFFGNSFNPLSNSYLYNYEVLEVFADYSFALGDHATSIFIDYVTNLDAGQFDNGYAMGFNIGSAKAAGTWKFGWMYKDIEADAVFGLLTDSDFAGGGTDGKGHVLKSSYAIAPNWNANMTYFMNETGSNTGAEKDYDRLQLDMSFKY
jgi:hypothetical protein